MQRYADAAIELAGTILASQERKRPAWDIPLLGFFYTGPRKDRILHYCHRGREQAPILALTRLCDAFPNHPDWMKWYSAVALYAAIPEGGGKVHRTLRRHARVHLSGGRISERA